MLGRDMDQSGLEHIEGGRSWRIIGLIVGLVIAGLAAFFIYQTVFSSGGGKAEDYQPYTVTTMDLRALVITSGVAVAQDEADLSFTIPGQIDTIDVALGDQVKAGQPLMSIKADQLRNAVATAESALAMARLQLKKMEEGATDADIAKAGLAVVTAQDTLTKAENELQNALDAPENAEITAAEQAVAGAQAALSAAEAKLDTLENGASDADLAAAQAAVVKADAGLSQAEMQRDTAQSNRDDAASSFESAAKTYCGTDGHVEDVCNDVEANNYADPLTSAQVDDIMAEIAPEPTPVYTPTPLPTTEPTSTPTPIVSDLWAATQVLVYANTTYRNAITTVDGAEEQVTAAEAAVDAADAALEQLEDGATSEDITAGEDAVAAARWALAAAQAAYQKLLDGASGTTITNLRSTVTMAQVAVASAISARDELLRGATETELNLQREQVHQAELAVDKAHDALDDATLVSPFDGVVASLPVKVGDSVSPALPAVTILTPGAITFELNVGETELPDLRVGQEGAVVFDAIPGQPYPIKVVAIGLSPSAEQGVLIYKVKTVITGDLSDTSKPQPAPGMNGSATIVTNLKAGVVAVPASVIRARGTEKVVEVVVGDHTELRPVTTGLSDNENIEITSGLQAGDVIALRGAAQNTNTTSTEDLPGNIR
jgi:RND family efflux transporter MFP subunit